MQTTKNKINSTAVAAKTISACRVCGQTDLLPLLSLGDQYLSDFVTAMAPDAPQAPLELVLCEAATGGCGLLQLRHTAAAESMYRNYWYRSGINQTMRDALRDITQTASRLVPPGPNDIVLDIGSNDNTLLKSYDRPGSRRIGFEPATNILPYGKDPNITVINDFFSAAPFLQQTNGQRANIITSIAMFYDLDDPNTFTADIAACLDNNGLWIIQMAYLPSMLLNTIFDNICHEHLEYYSLLSLEALLARHGLKVIDAELNDVNGGSYRIYATHQSNTSLKPFDGASQRLQTLRQQEADLKLDTAAPYIEFAARVNEIKTRVTDFIKQQVAAGKTVYAYGASTKGNTLLQYFNLDHTLITAAAERNPDKWGKKTVGTMIPIISEEAARAAQPDFFLVLPWHFMPEFLQREQAYLEAGGQFIVPLPEFRVIGKST